MAAVETPPKPDQSESETWSQSSDVTYNRSRSDFVEKVRASNAAVQAGQFNQAVALYTEALALDPHNYILYSNRSAALMKLGEHKRALEDAALARQLNPKWAKAYYREGVALQALKRDADALASFASGLAEDPKSSQLLQGLVDAALKSPLKDKFGGVYSQLQKMRLDQSPFVVIAVLGQELLSAGCFSAAVVVLESALRIGTCSLKLRGSVFSALSSAHWGLHNTDKAIACMLQDLAIAKSLADQEGECRGHGNLGSAYHAKGNYKEALTHHRFQLVLALRLKDRATAASVLSSLGHVYTAIGDYPNALASHKQCVLLLKQEQDRLREAREIGNVGAVYLAMGDVDSSLECHREHLKLARQLKDRMEEARAYSNLGSAHHFKRQYEKAISFHNQVLTIGQELTDATLQARAYAGLGHAARCCQDYKQAKRYHEKQLDIALQSKDRVAEGRACSNLGIIYQLLNQYDAALKLHQAHLKIAKDLGDRTSQGRAYGNMGNAHSCLRQYDLAIRFHKQELAISKEVGDCHSEAATHGNLAVAYQALNMHDQAQHHYTLHLQMARELKDSVSEARALNNLGNYKSSRKDFSAAIPYYEQFLILSQELHDVVGEGKACHRLGYAHYCLGQHAEAVRYYQQDLTLARDRGDQPAMCRAYCNLGLAHKALGDHAAALECQRSFLSTAMQTGDTTAQFCALSNIGDVLVKMGDLQEAITIFNQQLDVARQSADRRQEATCLCNLGSVQRVQGDLAQALSLHQQELRICQDLGDVKAQCKAHGAIGNVHMVQGDYEAAYNSYKAQLNCARQLHDPNIEAPVYGNLAITQMNSGQWDAAIGFLEQQLALLQQSNSTQSALQRGKAAGGLGDCYEALGDFEEAVRCQEAYLTAAQTAQSIPDQDRAYRGLGNAHRAMGNLQQALVCFEKRLVVAHELDKPAAKSSAYGELGCLHSLLGNFEQAVACLQHQLRIAREMGDQAAESDAACGLGGVFQQMADYDKALEYHALDLAMAQATENPHGQCRAYGNLGLSHESLGNFEKAISCQEQHLQIAAQIQDDAAKTLAYSSLGRVHHAMGNFQQAVQYLQQGLQIAEASGRHEDEAKIRHRLGLALWGHSQLHEAQMQLYKAAELFETIRRDQLISTDYKLSLFDLQTASYQALQRVLVALGHTEDALVVAERGRTRAFVDFLLERQQSPGTESWPEGLDSVPVTLDNILQTVQRQRAAVLYYSIAAGYLYSWLLAPKKGIVKFHECNVSELEVGSDPEDCQSLRSLNVSTASLLDTYVGHVREALGVDAHLSGNMSRMSASRSSLSAVSLGRSSSLVQSETESEAEDLWQQQLEELGDRLNAETDRTGFLRMVNRNHVFNASSLSLSSLLSVGSISGLSRASVRRATGTKPPLSALYELLIAPMEESLAGLDCPDLVLVLQGDLYLVPFAVLRGQQADPCLYERYSLLVVPSIRAVQASEALMQQNQYNPECSGALVLGNVKLPASVTEQWGWGPLPGADVECRTVAEMLGVRALTGSQTSKEAVTRQMANMEVLHLATHVSWKLAALVLSPSEFSTGTTSMHGNIERMELNDSAASDMNGSLDGPPLSDFLLTAADILNIQLSARLVILSSGHTEDRAGRINADGVVGLTRAFLAAGAQCVLFSLWPLPEMASRVLLKAFFTGLLQGAPCSRALSDAMRSVQNMKQFSHPSNWAGWVLVGSDVRLSSKVALMGHALCQLLQTPTKSREAMRVVLHLVEKSLQRIHHGQRHAMYTTQTSIQNKVGAVTGWRDLLTAVGFRLEGPVNGLPAAVFFPTSDPGDRLAQCSASLQALLGLPVATLSALSKMVNHKDVGEAVTNLVRDLNTQFQQDTAVQIQVPVRLWRAPGSHELLASLGFDLVDVGKEEITVKSGKQANRRCLSFALQALVAVFNTQEAPRTLLLDSSSSMESLASSGSATSTSNFSKGSSPPGSPSNKRRSFFNPAEVDKLPSAKPGQVKSGSSSSRRCAPDLSLSLVHQSAIRQKYSSPGSTSEDTDVAPSDGGETWSGRAQRGYLPPNSQPPVIYSSDSEDASDLTRAGYSRSSQISLSSTLTGRSVGSSGMRRSRFRASQASIRSSASDRTIIADVGDGREGRSYERAQQFTLDGLPDQPEKGILKTKGDDRRSMKMARSEEYSKRSLNSFGRAKSLSNISNVGQTEARQDYSSTTLDPSSLAMKVLAETRQQRAALEKMQRQSIQKLQERHSGDADSVEDAPLSSVPAVPSKPVASVQPSVHVSDLDESMSDRQQHFRAPGSTRGPDRHKPQPPSKPGSTVTQPETVIQTHVEPESSGGEDAPSAGRVGMSIQQRIAMLNAANTAPSNQDNPDAPPSHPPPPPPVDLPESESHAAPSAPSPDPPPPSAPAAVPSAPPASTHPSTVEPPPAAPSLAYTASKGPPSSPMPLRHSINSGFSRYVAPASSQPPTSSTMWTPMAAAEPAFQPELSPLAGQQEEPPPVEPSTNWYDSDSRESDCSTAQIARSQVNGDVGSSLVQSVPFYTGPAPAALTPAQQVITRARAPPLPTLGRSHAGFQGPQPGSAFTSPASSQPRAAGGLVPQTSNLHGLSSQSSHSSPFHSMGSSSFKPTMRPTGFPPPPPVNHPATNEPSSASPSEPTFPIYANVGAPQTAPHPRWSQQPPDPRLPSNHLSGQQPLQPPPHSSVPPHGPLSQRPQASVTAQPGSYETDSDSQRNQSQLREVSMRMFGPRSSQRSLDNFHQSSEQSGEEKQKKIMASLC